MDASLLGTSELPAGFFGDLDFARMRIVVPPRRAVALRLRALPIAATPVGAERTRRRDDGASVHHAPHSARD